MYQWRQLENLYFREKKFSVEIHDQRRSNAQNQGSWLWAWSSVWLLLLLLPGESPGRFLSAVCRLLMNANRPTTWAAPLSVRLSVCHTCKYFFGVFGVFRAPAQSHLTDAVVYTAPPITPAPPLSCPCPTTHDWCCRLYGLVTTRPRVDQ